MVRCPINELGAGVNQAGADGISALWMAAAEGKLDFVRNLLKLRANVNQANSDGFTPLMAASAQKHEDVVKMY
jgi:ankyrin repeat protein